MAPVTGRPGASSPPTLRCGSAGWTSLIAPPRGSARLPQSTGALDLGILALIGVRLPTEILLFFISDLAKFSLGLVVLRGLLPRGADFHSFRYEPYDDVKFILNQHSAET